MAYLTQKQIAELTSAKLRETPIFIVRGDSRVRYKLEYAAKHGCKGVVWRGTDDLGEPVAIKLVPSEEYSIHSLIDEMSEAAKLNPRYFAKVYFFGDLNVPSVNLDESYKAITTEWLDGCDLESFVGSNPLTVDEFCSIAEQLFTALAVLRRTDLCHDDLHAGNVMVQNVRDALTNEVLFAIRVIDTGTIKRTSTREYLLKALRDRVSQVESSHGDRSMLDELKSLLRWKEPDDHLYVVESLLHAANSLAKNYGRLDFWERNFFDRLLPFFQKLTDPDLSRRLDTPERVMSELRALVEESKAEGDQSQRPMSSPFDYISAEMIRNDREFAQLFSRECPWLRECESLEPLYVYGPRGCGKSSILRWLSFKTIVSDPVRSDPGQIREVGVYVSCSVELRSRFWLLKDATIDQLQLPIIRYFNLLLAEELFETLLLMWRMQQSGTFHFGFNVASVSEFADWVTTRMQPGVKTQPRLQGQSHLEYLKGLARKARWDTWANIQRAEPERGLPDPSLVSDVCKALPEYFGYFHSRHVTFLVDDYSNQRIPPHLQRKLNQTISFAKQGTPIFKVSSEYNGVDLEGIQEGREVVEINIGEKYTSLLDAHRGVGFLKDIVNIRLAKAKYKPADIEVILGATSYGDKSMPRALADETGSTPFYYHGIECIHQLCSGDVALALDLIKRIFDDNYIGSDTKPVPKHAQHKTIQRFSHEEVKRIRSIVPHGEEMFDIVCYLGLIARAVVTNKRSAREDKEGEPACMTHVDIRVPAVRELEEFSRPLAELYDLLTSRAILFSLETSRSRKFGAVERLQMRRIYFPAFKAPIKRDTPIKIDSVEELKSLLSNPRAFAERELKRAGLPAEHLREASKSAVVKPRE